MEQEHSFDGIFLMSSDFFVSSFLERHMKLNERASRYSYYKSCYLEVREHTLNEKCGHLGGSLDNCPPT